jgi:hypothetical protein
MMVGDDDRIRVLDFGLAKPTSAFVGGEVLSRGCHVPSYRPRRLFRGIFLSVVLMVAGGSALGQDQDDASSSSGELVVLADGTRIEVLHYEVKGRLVVFTTLDGKLRSVARAGVDLDATRRVNGVVSTMPLRGCRPGYQLPRRLVLLRPPVETIWARRDPCSSMVPHLPTLLRRSPGIARDGRPYERFGSKSP